jgi:predicted methyltransferase
VITARNIHDWMWTPGRLDKALADFHAALKAGGLLGVEEHRADPRKMVAEARDGYVETAWLTNAVTKAGFHLEAASEINANPKDTKDHPFGVWTLPPTRRSHEKDQPTSSGFDAAKYDAIGESDRMTLRFRKV